MQQNWKSWASYRYNEAISNPEKLTTRQATKWLRVTEYILRTYFTPSEWHHAYKKYGDGGKAYFWAKEGLKQQLRNMDIETLKRVALNQEKCEGDNTRYKCNTCGKEHDYEQGIINHIKAKHHTSIEGYHKILKTAEMKEFVQQLLAEQIIREYLLQESLVRCSDAVEDEICETCIKSNKHPVCDYCSHKKCLICPFWLDCIAEAGWINDPQVTEEAEEDGDERTIRVQNAIKAINDGKLFGGD